MTEHLRVLMRDEADHLEIPHPPTTEILGAGRSIRQRRRLTAGTAALALAAVAGTGAIALLDGRPTADVANEPAVPAYSLVYASGSTVVLDGTRASVPGVVHDLQYTSEGVLVRSNQSGGVSDGSGTESLTLVGAGGETVDLGVMPEGVGPATDPDQPVYALAEPSGDGFVAVIRDVRTRAEMARVPLPDLPMSYWEVPPLSLSGDTLYAGFKNSTWAVDWPTGEGARTVPGVDGGLPEIAGDRAVAGSERQVRIVDVTTGEEVLSVETDGYAFGQLSPDGSRLLITSEPDTASAERVTTLYDTGSGRSRELPTLPSVEGNSAGWSWAPDDRAVTPDGRQLLICDLTGCETDLILDGLNLDDLRYGGGRRES